MDAKLKKSLLGGRAGLFWLAVLVACLLLAACASGPDTIADLKTIPQDPAALLGSGDPAACLLQPAYQRARDLDFDQRWFDCWQRDNPRHSREEILELAGPVMDSPGVGENLRPRSAAWYQGLLNLAQIERYPSTGWRGVTIGPCDLRVLPTSRPDFASATAPGQGFPFDRLQQSAAPGGMPLRVWHASPGGDWLLVETPLAAGWLRAGKVARAGAAFRARWQSGRYLAVIADDAALHDEQGRFLFKVSIGAVLPRLGREAKSWRVLALRTGAGGEALATEARLPLAAGAPKPLPATPANLAQVASQLLGRPYGWGGLFGNRDCSALTQDLMIPFGLWLPRNSADQANQGGQFIDLSHLDMAAKERAIKQRGVPYLTLLWIPGHVMLYLGSPQGRPLVLHSIWGLKTLGPGGEGRHLIGRTVITGLTPGAELPHLARPEGLLLHRIQGMVLLAPPGALCPRPK